MFAWPPPPKKRACTPCHFECWHHRRLACEDWLLLDLAGELHFLLSNPCHHKSCCAACNAPCPCHGCVTDAGDTKPLQTSPGCAGAEQLCLAIHWQLGVGGDPTRNIPGDPAAGAAPSAIMGKSGTRGKAAPCQTKHFKAFISSQAAALQWDRGICALSIVLATEIPTKFLQCASQPLQPWHYFQVRHCTDFTQILWCCPVRVPPLHTCW